MIGTAEGANAQASDSDQAGHDRNPPAGGFEPRPLLNMSLQEAKMPLPVDAMMRCLVRNGIECLKQPRSVLGFCRLDLRGGDIAAEYPAAEAREEGALLVRERNNVDADCGRSLRT